MNLTKSTKARTAEKIDRRLQERPHHPAPSGPYAHILALQRAAGNRAVSRMMQSAGESVPHRNGGVPPIVHDVLRAPGQSLDPPTRTLMESRFGQDFGQVRVHTDAKADESARAVQARAYTVGPHIIFRTGLHRPDTDSGQRLLVHELTHVIQQPANEYRGGSLELSQQSDTSEREAHQAASDTFVARPITASPVALHIAREADPASIADRVIEKENKPDPIAGIGDYRAAFEILSDLDTATLLQVLTILDEKFYLELLQTHIGAAIGDEVRLETAVLAVRYGRRGLDAYHLKRGFELYQSLEGSQAEFRSFLETNFGVHKRIAFTEGEEAETERLAKLQLAFLESKRKDVPTGEIGKVLEQEVKSRALPPIPTAQWDNLSDADKKDWTDKRAPAALSKLTANIKGTELEPVMKGHDFKFEPRKMLERGGYAYQSGNDLVVGMAFIKDVEADPKNVWGIIAHEIGGHFAYGGTYAKKIMDKVLVKLPEAEREKWTEGKAAVEFFDAFIYAETEIFAALRQRRYDVPVSGPAPTHGAMKPDDNIEIELTAIDKSFPKEVGTAILIEINDRVQGDLSILDRDKKYFLDQVKKHGYSL